MLLTELEEFDKIVHRDSIYLTQFGNAIDGLKEWIICSEHRGDPNRHITCHELATFLKNYIKYKAEFVAPPSGYKFAEPCFSTSSQPQKIKCHSVINKRECMEAMGEDPDKSDYDEDGLFKEVDQ